MSTWESHVRCVVERVLQEEPLPDPPDHHLGRPFLTAYQIALLALEREPAILDRLNLELGGRGIGQHQSFTQYLGRHLSQAVRRSGEDGPIEGPSFPRSGSDR